MRCRECQTEIDDKALICYRCGTATQEAVHQPYVAKDSRAHRFAPIVLSLVFLGAVGFFVFEAQGGREISPLVWAMLAAAGVLLAVRLRLRK